MSQVDRNTAIETLVPTFLQDIKQANTHDAYANGVAAFFRFVDEVQYNGHIEAGPPYPATLLDNKLLAEYYRWLDNYYTPHTITTYLAALKRFLIWLEASDYLPATFSFGKAQNTLKAILGKNERRSYKLKTPDPELPRIVTYYDNLELVEGVDHKTRTQRLTLLRNRALFHTLYATAGRVSEVAGLTRDQVLDGRIDEVTIIGKGDKQRVILLTVEAMTAIRHYTKERIDASPYLFVGHGNRSKGKALGRKVIWRLVKEAAKALDLHKDTSPHTFRHYRATQLLNEGMPLELVQAYLGHESIETTRKIYAHTHTAVLKRQLQVFDKSPAEALDDLARRREKPTDAE